MITLWKTAGHASVWEGLLLSLCLVSAAFAQATAANPDAADTSAARNASTASKHVEDAVKIVQTMRSDARLERLLMQAQGLFVVPSYTRIALGIGGGGGAGLLLARLADGSWSEPAFYHVGSISVGLQVGAQSGPAALVLNSSKAVDAFRKNSNFSLNADVGLTVANWSVASSAEAGDIVAWSSNVGLFGNAVTASVSDIMFSRSQTDAFYGQSVRLDDVLAGRMVTGKADGLRQALTSR